MPKTHQANLLITQSGKTASCKHVRTEAKTKAFRLLYIPVLFARKPWEESNTKKVTPRSKVERAATKQGILMDECARVQAAQRIKEENSHFKWGFGGKREEQNKSGEWSRPIKRTRHLVAIREKWLAQSSVSCLGSLPACCSRRRLLSSSRRRTLSI
jgi:hypothetical protein